MDYYEVLGIDNKADENQVKQAFRRLARKYHPDVNPAPDASEMFRLVYISYEILIDPYKRRIYDELLESRKRPVSYSGYNYEWDTQANKKAYEYSEMHYEEFKETLLDKISFQFSQGIAFVSFFALLILGTTALLFGIQKFNTDVNGAKTVGAMCCVFGGGIIYFALKAINGIFKAWRRK